MVPKSSPGTLGRTLGRTLGAHLGALGGTLKSCRDALGALGALWGALGALLARSWTRLEGCWTLQNALRSIFVLPKSIWDPSGADFDHSENGLGGSKRGFSQPTCICVNLHVRMHIMLNNSQLTLAMPYIPKFAVILSSLCSVIPAQGRRSREASSISNK